MSKSGRELSPDEKKLWRRVAATVKARRVPADPTAASEGDALAPKPEHPRTTFRAPERHRAPASSPPADRAGEKRVRRGKVEVGGSLDLHGHTQQSGRAALVRFLSAAQARGDRAVVVVTGVGRAGEGVLRQRLPEWLAERDLRPLVSGYAQAHRSHGGRGAFYVFIKQAR